MFTNQIPQLPDFARGRKPRPKPWYANPSDETYPQPHDQAQGWGLSFFYLVYPSATGRSGKYGWWGGLPNLIWWADRERGIGGLISTQILPYGGKEFSFLLQLNLHWFGKIIQCMSYLENADIEATTDREVFACQAEIESALYAALNGN